MDVIMWSAYVQAFCRILLGLIFLLSSVGKLRDMVGFRKAINNFQIFPPQFDHLIARLFVGCEIIVVILLVIGGPMLLYGFFLAIFLLTVFSSALVSVLIRKLSISCHCFGSSTRSVSLLDIWRNIGLLLCALFDLLTLVKVQHSPVRLDLFAWLFIGGLAVIVALVWTQLGEIIQLFHVDSPNHT